MKIGYAQVSTQDQNLALQTDALNRAGVVRLFTDMSSGSNTQRDGLKEMLYHAREGDVVVIWRLDRLARSLKDLIEIAAQLQTRNVGLISLMGNIDTTTPTGRLFFHIFGALAEFERNLTIERTQAGLTAARSRGRKGGRKRVLDDAKKKVLNLLLLSSNDYRSHAKAINVSERTVRRYALVNMIKLNSIDVFSLSTRFTPEKVSSKNVNLHLIYNHTQCFN
jgi:DNA invertase Pin-like site-specific DNA recombinase